jgi:predicted DCC family thiol-disulfide oxidoreductase YuxK
MPYPILLYDGVCGLCNGLVQFVLRRDRNAIFRFASLQSALSGSILARHGANPTDLDTVYVVLNPELGNVGLTKKHPAENGLSKNDSIPVEPPNESLLSRSDAVLFVLDRLGGAWRMAAFCLRLWPRFLRDAAYNAVARRRYRIFGRSETCTLPSVQDRGRFLDL